MLLALRSLWESAGDAAIPQAQQPIRLGGGPALPGPRRRKRTIDEIVSEIVASTARSTRHERTGNRQKIRRKRLERAAARRIEDEEAAVMLLF